MGHLNINRYLGVSDGSLTIKEDKKSKMNRLGERCLKFSFRK